MNSKILTGAVLFALSIIIVYGLSSMSGMVFGPMAAPPGPEIPPVEPEPVPLPITEYGFNFTTTTDFDAGNKGSDNGNFLIETYSDNLQIPENAFALGNMYSDRFTYDWDFASGGNWKWSGPSSWASVAPYIQDGKLIFEPSNGDECSLNVYQDLSENFTVTIEYDIDFDPSIDKYELWFSAYTAPEWDGNGMELYVNFTGMNFDMYYYSLNGSLLYGGTATSFQGALKLVRIVDGNTVYESAYFEDGIGTGWVPIVENNAVDVATYAHADDDLYLHLYTWAGNNWTITSFDNFNIEEGEVITTASLYQENPDSYNYTEFNWQNPENVLDGDWDTDGKSGFGTADLYVNYTIPSNDGVLATWNTKYGLGTTINNYSIPAGCINGSVLQLRIQSVEAVQPLPNPPLYATNWHCWGYKAGGFVWQEIETTILNSDPQYAHVYEEAITWEWNESHALPSRHLGTWTSPKVTLPIGKMIESITINYEGADEYNFVKKVQVMQGTTVKAEIEFTTETQSGTGITLTNDDLALNSVTGDFNVLVELYKDESDFTANQVFVTEVSGIFATKPVEPTKPSTGGGTTPTFMPVEGLTTQWDGTSLLQGMALNDKIKFFHGTNEHTIQLTSISANSIVFRISSDSFPLTVNLGETKLVDVDGDGTEDVSITFSGLEAGKAMVNFETIQTAQITAKTFTFVDIINYISNYYKGIASFWDVLSSISKYYLG